MDLQIKSKEQLMIENEELRTKLHQLEEEYQQTIVKDNKRLNTILESIIDGFISLDDDWNFLYVNKEAEKILMRKREELLGKNIWEIFSVAIGKPIYHEFHRAKLENRTIHFEHEGLRTGKIYDTVVYPSEMGITVYFLDITEQKQIQNENKQLASIVESSRDAILSIRTDGSIVSFNQGAVQMLEYAPSEMINDSILSLFPADMHETITKKMKTVILGNDTYYFQTQLIRKDNKKIEAYVSIFPIKEANEDITGLSLIARDISDMINLKKELIKLDRLNVIGQMSAGVGHEIRNPMTSIRGFLQLLSQKDQYDPDKQFFDLMIEEIDRVNSIITELLLLGKTKAVDLKENNLENILKIIEPILLADALRLGMNLEFNYGNVPNIQLNEEEIRQLIYNLVKNGLEAMEPGGTIYISTSQKKNRIILSIKDEGKGMDKELLAKIGTPFFTTKDYGTGLGLAICNGIATRNNAHIDIKSNSKGTTVNVIFKHH